MSPADPPTRLPAEPPVSPDAVAEAFEAAWNAADADALADLFAEDADFVNVVGVWWTRRRQIRLDHARGFRWMFPDSRLALGRLRVRDLGEVAVVHAPWTMAGLPAVALGEDGADADGERTGVLLLVTRRTEAGTWEVVAAQNTDRVPDERVAAADDGALATVHHHPSAWLETDDDGPEAG